MRGESYIFTQVSVAEGPEYKTRRGKLQYEISSTGLPLLTLTLHAAYAAACKMCKVCGSLEKQHARASSDSSVGISVASFWSRVLM